MTPRVFRVYDSETGEEFPDHGIYSLSYEPHWQLIRMATRGEWHTLELLRKACARLQVYMDRIQEPTVEKTIRVQRVYTLLNAIPYSRTTTIGIHIMPREASDFLLAYRETVRKLLRSLPVPCEWDWKISRVGLRECWARNPEQMNYIYNTLVKRPLRNDRAKPELEYYLKLCVEIQIQGDSV